MTPRARDLTTYAHLVLDIERDAVAVGIPIASARGTVIERMTNRAAKLGFADDEIASAVANAIGVATRGEEDVSR